MLKLVVLLTGGLLTTGHEREEADEIWNAVLREASRMRTVTDEVRLAELLHHATATYSLALTPPARTSSLA